MVKASLKFYILFYFNFSLHSRTQSIIKKKKKKNKINHVKVNFSNFK